MHLPLARMLPLLFVVATAGAQAWVDRTSAMAPLPRYGHAMAFDPVRGYTVLVGGFGEVGAFSETWTWDGVTWTNRQATLPASQYALAFHASTNDLLLHAGAMHRWTGQSWQALGGGVFGNGGRVAMAFDPVRNETILWTPGLPAAVGVWDGAQLQTRNVAAAPYLGASVLWHEMAWDPTAQRVVLAIWYGGNQSRFYEWSGFGWNQRFPAALPPGGVHALSSDLARQCVVALDGDFQSLAPNHAWQYRTGVCTQLASASEPTLRMYAAMAYDSLRDVHVLFGGMNSLPMGDTWELGLGSLAGFANFGAACAGSAGTPELAAVPGALPRAGATMSVRVSNLPAAAPAVMLLGVSDAACLGVPLPFDLASFGAPGCRLLTSLEDLLPIANAQGEAVWTYPVPSTLGARFYVQAVAFDAAANALGLVFSGGGRATIGP